MLKRPQRSLSEHYDGRSLPGVAPWMSAVRCSAWWSRDARESAPGIFRLDDLLVRVHVKRGARDYFLRHDTRMVMRCRAVRYKFLVRAANAERSGPLR